MTDERTNLSKMITRNIKQNFGSHIKIFDQTIPRCVKAAESTGVGESIFMYDKHGAATRAYEKLTKEVFLNEEKNHRRYKDTYIR